MNGRDLCSYCCGLFWHWGKMQEYWSRYFCRSWSAVFISGLLFGHSVAENGFFGFFIFFVQQNLKVRNLRASVAIANVQGAISAMLSIWMIYFGCYRARSLSRMILYAYSTYIAGMLLLWLGASASTQVLRLALVLITIGQAGERCLVYFFGVGWEEGAIYLPTAPPPLPPSPPPPPPPSPPPPPPPPVPCLHRKGTEEKKVNDKETLNDFKKKVRLVFARAPGAIIGAFYVSSLSWDQTFKFTALAMLAGYHIFFWLGPKIFYNQVSTIEEKNERELEICKKKDGATPLLDQLKEAIRVLGSERLLPLWLTFTFTCNLVSATGNTFFVAQVGYLVKNAKQSLRISESTFYFVMQNLATATSLVCDYLIIKKLDKREQWLVRLFRVVVGMIFSFLCCIVACLVEGRRSDSGSNSISVFWLVPQYLLLGLMRGIGNDGLSGFLSDCVPKSDSAHKSKCPHKSDPVRKSRKNKIIAVCAVAEVFGNIVSAVLASVSPSSWIGKDVGRSDLYYYYRMLAFISLCSSVLFVIIVSGFKSQGKYPTQGKMKSVEQRPNTECSF